MTQSQNVARLRPPRQQCLDCVFHPAIGEVAQERVSGAQGKKCQRGRLVRFPAGEKPVDDLIRRAIAPDGNELAISARIGVPR
jgi:hypothetical protein